MRFWISRTSDVSVREQLATQIMLAITSKELQPGAKLPSTRALGRKLGLHANTVNASYRDLEARGWLEARKGSGVFVRVLEKTPPAEGLFELDRLIAELTRTARQQGFSLGEIRSRTRHWLTTLPPDHFLLIEDDSELRRILEHEIVQATGFPVKGVALEDLKDPDILTGATPVALYGRSERVQRVLPPDTQAFWLRSRSVQDELGQSFRPPTDSTLVTVVSRWPEFLKWARTILLAAGVKTSALSVQDARRRGWQKGLAGSTAVVADSMTARSLPARFRSRCIAFPVLSESSLLELKSYGEEL